MLVMIFVGIGSNQPGQWGTPAQTVARALEELNKPPLRLVKASKPIETEPFGLKNQPNFINAVVEIETELETPEQLMRHLHDIELAADRRRSVRWGPRTLDLDLLDFHGLIYDGEGLAHGHQRPLILPHPGIVERLFVLEPLAEIAPDWRHPVSGDTVKALIDRLKSG